MASYIQTLTHTSDKSLIVLMNTLFGKYEFLSSAEEYIHDTEIYDISMYNENHSIRFDFPLSENTFFDSGILVFDMDDKLTEQCGMLDVPLEESEGVLSFFSSISQMVQKALGWEGKINAHLPHRVKGENSTLVDEIMKGGAEIHNSWMTPKLECLLSLIPSPDESFYRIVLSVSVSKYHDFNLELVDKQTLYLVKNFVADGIDFKSSIEDIEKATNTKLNGSVFKHGTDKALPDDFPDFLLAWNEGLSLNFGGGIKEYLDDRQTREMAENYVRRVNDLFGEVGLMEYNGLREEGIVPGDEDLILEMKWPGITSIATLSIHMKDKSQFMVFLHIDRNYDFIEYSSRR